VEVRAEDTVALDYGRLGAFLRPMQVIMLRRVGALLAHWMQIIAISPQSQLGRLWRKNLEMSEMLVQYSRVSIYGHCLFRVAPAMFTSQAFT
jgi:hypothetical protein